MANFYGKTGIELRDGITPALERLKGNLRNSAVEAAVAGAEIIRAKAYAYANVSEGVVGYGVHGEHMRDEIHVDSYTYERGVAARIQINTTIIPYAPHQEFGPHGNRFMTRAVDESRYEVHERMREVLTFELGSNGQFKTSVRMRNFA